jgi:hypothetical protein
MFRKTLPIILMSGLLLGVAQSPSLAYEGGGGEGGHETAPVRVERERRPDGTTVTTTYSPGGVSVVVRDANGKVISRKRRK